MSDPLDAWCDEVERRLRGVSREAAERYASGGDHHRAVARMIDERFHDRPLATAAFLHAAGSSLVRAHLADAVDPVALELLETAEKFRAFNAGDPDLPHRLRKHWLTLQPMRRAGRMLVLDQYHHLNPDGRLAEWSRRFHSTPAPADELPAAARFPDSFAGWEDYAAFVRAVTIPTAEWLHLWHERNVLEDALLLFTERDRFLALLRFAGERAGGQTRNGEWVEQVRRRACDANGVQVRWEWRHIAGMGRRLAGTPPFGWDDEVQHCGFVTVVCPTEAACYEVLGRLHAAFRYPAEGLRRGLREATPTGYRGMHTTLLMERAGGAGAVPVRVRIIPEEVERDRLLSSQSSPQDLNDGEMRVRSAETITVYAPDGTPRVLPAGALVLNFAQIIHNEMVVLARGARVNHEQVDLLHPLRDGDVVWLHVGAAPRPLPAGWEARVPRHTARPIRKAFRRHYRTALAQNGRRWVRQELLTHGLAEPPNDEQLDAIVMVAGRRFAGVGGDRVARWCLEQLGILHARMHGELLPHRQEMEEERATELIGAVCRETLRALPGAGRRQSFGLQYFTVEGVDRPGLVADLTSAFTERRVTIAELHAVRPSPGRGLVRIRTDPVAPAMVPLLLEALRDVHGVTTVRGPDASATHDEGEYLPPRTQNPSLAPIRPAPYPNNSAVRSDVNFYGMTRPRVELHAAFDRLGDLTDAGVQVFVEGPKKVGKTSLVLAFFRELARRGPRAPLTVHLEGGLDEPWSRYAAKLAARLCDRAVEAEPEARTRLTHLRASGAATLGEIVAEVIRCIRRPLVLAIDEAVNVLYASMRAGESGLVLDFNSCAWAQPDLMVVWVGPTAGTRYLSGALQHVLVRTPASVPVRPFEPADLAAFVRAEKLAPYYNIQADEGVLKVMQKDTAGNPHWAAHLARAMFEAEEAAGHQLPRYDLALLRTVRQKVVANAHVFSDRYVSDVWTPERRALVRAVLSVLAEDLRANPNRSSGLSFEALEERLADHLPPGGTKGLPMVLEELCERGALVQPQTRDGACTWRVAAPLLADHVAYARGREPEAWT